MDVREVLARTLQDLDELQMQIEPFMAFLINIQRVMADIQDDHKQVLIGNSTTGVLDAYNQDKKLRQVCYPEYLSRAFTYLIYRITTETLMTSSKDSSLFLRQRLCTMKCRTISSFLVYLG